MRQRVPAVLAALLVSIGQIHAQEISPEARTYLETAIRIMQDNFLHKEKIDWERLRGDTLAQAAGAQTPVDTYPAIRFALGRLSDRHSFLNLTPAQFQEERSRRTARGVPAPPAGAAPAPLKPPSPFQNRRDPEGSIIQTGTRSVGRIVVPFFMGADSNAFATIIQNTVADVASKKPCGWIVDLRGNGGGNMWPMLAGIGPVLGEGEPGAFLNYEGKRFRWFYEKGKAGIRGSDRDYDAKTNGVPVVLAGSPPVAVLIDGGTGSSGEAIAVAFRGRPDTRFFGEPTVGVSNATFPFRLADGAQLYLVTAVDLDRNGVEYDSGVKPDEEVQNAAAGADDPAVRAASNWLLQQRACSVAQR